MSLTDILSVTGTFDVERFNKGFEEDTLRLLEEQERERKHIENLREAFEQEEEVEDVPPIPLEQEKFQEAIKKRTMIHKPISTWFSRQLILMSMRELQDNPGKKDLSPLSIVVAGLVYPLQSTLLEIDPIPGYTNIRQLFFLQFYKKSHILISDHIR